MFGEYVPSQNQIVLDNGANNEATDECQMFELVQGYTCQLLNQI